jgi:hypothetical protein
MKTFTYNQNLDLRRRPYRGVVAGIAKDEGVSRSAIVQALQIENPRIVTLFANEVKRIQKEQADAKKLLASLNV